MWIVARRVSHTQSTCSVSPLYLSSWLLFLLKRSQASSTVWKVPATCSVKTCGAQVHTFSDIFGRSQWTITASGTGSQSSTLIKAEGNTISWSTNWTWSGNENAVKSCRFYSSCVAGEVNTRQMPMLNLTQAKVFRYFTALVSNGVDDIETFSWLMSQVRLQGGPGIMRVGRTLSVQMSRRSRDYIPFDTY